MIQVSSLIISTKTMVIVVSSIMYLHNSSLTALLFARTDRLPVVIAGCTVAVF